MSFLAWVLICLAGLFWPLRVSAAQKGWVEARSPHFRVLSDGSEAEARTVVRQFERMRVAFATAMPWLRLDSPAPLLILAPKDEASIRTLFPEMWKRKRVKPGGFFARGWEKSFAVVRLDVVRRQAESGAGSDGYQVVYHEYTHSLLNANFRWLPDWLNEGLAEFFGNTQFKDEKIYLGAPNIRAQYTRGRPLLPLEKLTGAVLASPEYQDDDKVQLFYSESWGLVHFLLVPSAMERGKRLQQFLASLEDGVDQKLAFSEAIGNFKDIDAQLRRYLDRSEPAAFVFNNPSEITDEAISYRQLSQSETDAELGTVEVWLHENIAASQRLEQVLKEEPRSALAAQAMGFLKFAEGKDVEARAEFERAIQNDPTLYLSAYYRTMLLPAAMSDSREDRAEIRAAMNRILELNREFAPAYIQLAAGYIRDRNFESAIPLAVKAQQLWPSRAGYHLLIGNALHGVGRDTEAAAVARYVADRWQDINHDQAVELWQKLPVGVRHGADPAKRPSPPGTRMITGKITSVSCREKDQTMTIAIDGTPRTFRVKDEKLNIGLSDTVWFGADHFDRCHHLEGLRAVIQYVPSSASGIAGNLAQLELYDDFLMQR